jgi:hypothetical protein
MNQRGSVQHRASLSARYLAALAIIGATACSSGASSPVSTDAGAHDAAHEASRADAAKPVDAAAHEAAHGDAKTGSDDAAVDAPTSLDGWSVPTGCNPLAVTSECLLPYPNDLMTKADPTTVTGLRIALPANSLTVPATSMPIDMTPFNRFDGAPTSMPILVHFGVDVAASFLANDTQTASSLLATSPIALIDETTGKRVPFLSEMDANDPADPSRHALIIRPLAPLAFNTKYAVVLTNALRDTSGKALPVSLGFAALRDKITTSNAMLEGARARFETLFTFLESHGYPRADLALAWDYTTVSSQMVTGPITQMRQEVFHATTAKGPPLPDGGLPDGAALDAGSNVNADGGAQITYEIQSVTPSPYQMGANVIEGIFTPPNYLRADNTIDYAADGTPTLQTAISAPSYPFTMIVPPIAATQSLALVVFGHGLFGDGRDYLTTSFGSTIQPLAQQLGAVVVATNWIGLSDGDLQLIIDDVVPNVNRIGIVTDRLLQALVNNHSLDELALGALGADPAVRLSMAQPLIDPTRVYYFGVSLGGIEGSSFVSTSRNVTRGVVAVPGASWSNLLARSYDYQQIGQAISLVYPDELVQQEFIALLQARFDPADPVNLATLFQTNPLPDSPRARTVIIQEAIDDCQVPNLTTEILARAYGINQITPDIVPIFGLTDVTTPTTEFALSQFLLSSDVAKYVPPTTNVIPTMDNGAHFDLSFKPEALNEVITLFNTGKVVQFCGDAGAGTCVLP